MSKDVKEGLARFLILAMGIFAGACIHIKLPHSEEEAKLKAEREWFTGTLIGSHQFQGVVDHATPGDDLYIVFALAGDDGSKFTFCARCQMAVALRLTFSDGDRLKVHASNLSALSDHCGGVPYLDDLADIKGISRYHEDTPRSMRKVERLPVSLLEDYGGSGVTVDTGSR